MFRTIVLVLLLSYCSFSTASAFFDSVKQGILAVENKSQFLSELGNAARFDPWAQLFMAIRHSNVFEENRSQAWELLWIEDPGLQLALDLLGVEDNHSLLIGGITKPESEYWYHESAKSLPIAAWLYAIHSIRTASVNTKNQNTFHWVELLIGAANKGLPLAHTLLGQFYYHGYYVKKDIEKSRYHIEKAFWSTTETASQLLAINTNQYDINSLQIRTLESLAARAHAVANTYKYLLDKDAGHEVDQMLNDAMLNNYPFSFYIKYLELLENSNFVSADKLLKKAIKLDFVPALLEGAKQTEQRAASYGFTAFQLYYKAYLFGSDSAPFYIGRMLWKDNRMSEATYWLNRSDTRHKSQSALLLANILEREVEPDFITIFNHYHTAAKDGIVHAQFQLATFFEKGVGCEQSDEQAIKWLVEAANNGHAGAQRSIGIRYYYGNGTSPDFKKAKYWLHLASLENDAIAQYYLGMLYQNGNGVSVDVQKAIGYYKQSHTQGYLKATFRLAQVFERKNAKRSAEYYQKVIDAEHPLANLASLNQSTLSIQELKPD
ncbi:MAG: SEL1-like repeat protein [Gammaproteobacteria bacterium]|nr:SEL1-like repeat protein [Gammaproteobacteria bacterium]